MSIFWHCAQIGWLLVVCQLTYGQAAKSHHPVEVVGQVGYDSFFGVYPTLSVSKSLDSLHEIRAYSTLYTNPAFFGTETGLTFGFTSPRKTWSLMPGAALVSGSIFVEGRPFLVGEGYFGSLAAQYQRADWYAQGYGGYYGILQRRTPDAYDFGFYSLQAGRVLAGQTQVGLLYEWLGNVRQSRNAGDASEFTVARVGLAISRNLPARLMLQVAGGLTHGADQRAFFRVGLGWSLSRCHS